MSRDMLLGVTLTLAAGTVGVGAMFAYGLLKKGRGSKHNGDMDSCLASFTCKQKQRRDCHKRQYKGRGSKHNGDMDSCLASFTCKQKQRRDCHKRQYKGRGSKHNGDMDSCLTFHLQTKTKA